MSGLAVVALQAEKSNDVHAMIAANKMLQHHTTAIVVTNDSSKDGAGYLHGRSVLSTVLCTTG